MLYVLETPWSGGGRALVQGRIYTMEGRLICSVSQEGLVRVDTGKSQSETSKL